MTATAPALTADLRSELRAALAEACAGACDCRLYTAVAHVRLNAGRYPVLAALPDTELRELILAHHLTRRRNGEPYVGVRR